MVYQRFLKRLFDFLLSMLAILILSPILAILWLLILIFLGSPVLFRQERPGLNEKIFTIYKFRTMTNEKDQEGNLLDDKSRLTALGNFLRMSSLDELPELFNILKGDMSIVGPRPLLVKYLPLYNEKQKHRHDVRPGLTGYAQVNGRNGISWEEKFELDLLYIKKISFLGDLKIIFKTVRKVFVKDGIYQDGQAETEDFKGSE
jgi:lipopolysaccharide/colanic/teichoic acid biosynthesis glycosyltransferase